MMQDYEIEAILDDESISVEISECFDIDLTDYPLQPKLILTNQQETLSAFINPFKGFGFTNGFNVNFNFYDSGNNLINNHVDFTSFGSPVIASGTSSSILRWDIPVGTQYLSSYLTGSSYYTVDIAHTIVGTGFKIKVLTVNAFGDILTSILWVAGSGYYVGTPFTVNGSLVLANGIITSVDSSGGVTGYTMSYGGLSYNAGTVYDTTVVNGIVPISETRTFLLDNTCSIYRNVRLMWMNSYGAFDYFNFRLDDHKSFKVSRNEYKQILPLNYNIGQRQRTLLSLKSVEQHIVNTDWITEDQYAFVNNILLSLEVYIIDEITGDTYPVIITDSDVDYKTAYRDQIFNMTLTYETSYDYETQHQ